MQTFRYQGLGAASSGGTIQAEDRAEAIGILTRNGIVATSIESESDPQGRSPRLALPKNIHFKSASHGATIDVANGSHEFHPRNCDGARGWSAADAIIAYGSSSSFGACASSHN